VKTRNFPAKKALRRARAMKMNIRLPQVDDQRFRVGRPAYEDVVRELQLGWSAFDDFPDRWNATLGYEPARKKDR